MAGRKRKVGRPKGSKNKVVKSGLGWEGFKNFFTGKWSKDQLRA